MGNDNVKLSRSSSNSSCTYTAVDATWHASATQYNDDFNCNSDLNIIYTSNKLFENMSSNSGTALNINTNNNNNNNFNDVNFMSESYTKNQTTNTTTTTTTTTTTFEFTPFGFDSNDKYCQTFLNNANNNQNVNQVNRSNSMKLNTNIGYK